MFDSGFLNNITIVILHIHLCNVITDT